MIINVTFDQSASKLPTGFEACVEAACNYYEHLFTNNVTINIHVGYGEVGGLPFYGPPSESSANFATGLNYSQLISALTAQNAPGASSLPATTPLTGSLAMTSAEQKALGFVAANSSAIDGYMGYSAPVLTHFFYDPTHTLPVPTNGIDFMALVEHDLAEIMGKFSFHGQSGNSYAPMDLFRYSSAGTLQTTTGGPAYYSTDGGTTGSQNAFSVATDPGNSATHPDLGDWGPSVASDAYSAIAPLSSRAPMSALDLQLMQSLGWTSSGFVSDSQVNSALTAAAAVTAFHGGTGSASAPLYVVDSAANIAAAIDGLGSIASGGALGLITLTDSGTVGITVTSTQMANDAAALKLIAGTWTLMVTGVTAANATAVAAQAVAAAGLDNGTVSVTDTSSNVLANISALQTLAQNWSLSAINLTDVTSLTMTEAAYSPYSRAFAFAKNFSVTLNEVAAADVANLYSAKTLNIDDSAANIQAHLGDLGMAQIEGRLGSIAVTGTGPQTMALTASQWESYRDVMSHIQGSALAVTVTGGLPAYFASLMTSMSFISSVTVSDTATQIQNSLDALQILASQSKLAGITLTGGTVLTVSAPQLAADSDALAKLGTGYSLSISGVTVANAASVLSHAGVSSIAISDTAANIAAGLDSLQAIAGKITSIENSDYMPITVSQAQLTNDAQALALIPSYVYFNMAGISAASAVNTAYQGHVAQISVTDSAANVAANIDGLETVASSGKLTSVTLTDSGSPVLHLTAAQMTADYEALYWLKGNYGLSVSNVAYSSAAFTLSEGHVVSVGIVDTASQISNQLANLQTLAAAGKLTGITVNDGGSLVVSTAQMSADQAALSLLSGSYGLSVSGVSIANMTATLSQAHVSSISISDSAANVTAALDSLENLAVAGKLKAVSINDGGTLSPTQAQLTSDAQVLSEIGTQLVLKGVTAANAASTLASTHAQSVSVTDSAANVTANLDSLQSLAQAGQLGGITLTDSGQPILTLTSVQIGNDATAIAEIQGSYKVAATGLNAGEFAILLAGGHVSSASVSDSAASISANLDALQAATAAGTLTSVALTDGGTPKLAVTYAQLTSDAQVLHDIVGSHSLSVSGVAVANIAALHAQTGVASVGVTDSAAHLSTDLDGLQSLLSAGKLTALSVNDGGALSVTAAQMVSDAQVINDIAGNYTLNITDASLSALSPAIVSHASALSINDSGANISSNLDALESYAAAGKLTSVTISDSGFSTIAVSSTQLVSDAKALHQLSGNFIVKIDASAANLTLSGMDGYGNIASFSGTASDYSITTGSNGTVIITDTGTGRSSTDHLSGLTAIQFGDHTDIVAQTPGTTTVTTGNVTELYGAVFGRLPDVPGLNYYEQQLQSNPNLPLSTFAQWFLASPEYTSNPAHNYAQNSAGDAQFIVDSYTNLLGRAPEAAAVPYYQNIINIFTQGLTPGTAAFQAALNVGHSVVLTDFSASAEFLGDVTVTAQNPSSAQHWLVLTG